jgi:Ni,Fe-hydrogenase III small subunit
VEGGIDKAIPVTAYIPGCPASPQAIIDGFVKVVKMLEEQGLQERAAERQKVED